MSKDVCLCLEWNDIPLLCESLRYYRDFLSRMSNYNAIHKVPISESQKSLYRVDDILKELDDLLK